MVREWNLSLENTGGKQGSLKPPLGYNVDTMAVQIRSPEDATTTQSEIIEKVPNRSLIQSKLYILTISSCSFVTERLGLCQVTFRSTSDVPVYFLDDGLKSIYLHDNVHDVVRHEAIQRNFRRQLGL